MKKYLKSVVAFLLAFGLTLFFFWPIYQKILLDNQTGNIDQKINKLDLPLEEDIKEILGTTIHLPLNRYELCLKNKNKFHFIHMDSDSSGVPFRFYTNDLNQNDFGKTNKLGAMGINFYYRDNSTEVLLYREFGQPIQCVTLETKKLKNYASSTIEYSYVKIDRQAELDLGEQGKLAIFRSIVGGYFIDTSKSSFYIMARWEFFLLTLVVLFMFFSKTIKFLAEHRSKLFLVLTKLFTKIKNIPK